jgi:hypothetical protein
MGTGGGPLPGGAHDPGLFARHSQIGLMNPGPLSINVSEDIRISQMAIYLKLKGPTFMPSGSLAANFLELRACELRGISFTGQLDEYQQ